MDLPKNEISTIDYINLASSLSSLILSLLAISLALYFYNKSKVSEKNIEVAINKVGDVANTLNTLSMKLVTKLTNYVTSTNPREKALLEIVREATKAGPLEEHSETSSNLTNKELDQFRVNNLIAALFYAGIANTSLQFSLPENISDTDDVKSVVEMLDQSKKDYFTLKEWINSSKKTRVKDSVIKHMFSQAQGLERHIRSATELYAERQRNET